MRRSRSISICVASSTSARRTRWQRRASIHSRMRSLIVENGLQRLDAFVGELLKALVKGPVFPVENSDGIGEPENGEDEERVGEAITFAE